MPLYNPSTGGGGGASVPAQSRSSFGGNKQLSIPGLVPGDTATYTTSANRAQYFPFLCDTSTVIDEIVMELTTGVASSTSRVAIYNADIDWQPTSLVTGTDSGAFNSAVADVGVKTFSLSDTTLAAGRYLFWVANSGAGLAWRAIRGNAAQFIGYPTALTAAPGWSQIYVAQTYGAPPSTGLAWDSASTTGSPNTFSWIAWVREKTP